jgi:S-adenosylmethionine hydrolase
MPGPMEEMTTLSSTMNYYFHGRDYSGAMMMMMMQMEGYGEEYQEEGAR